MKTVGSEKFREKNHNDLFFIIGKPSKLEVQHDFHIKLKVQVTLHSLSSD